MDGVLEKPAASGPYSKAARAESARLPPGPAKMKYNKKPRVVEFPTPAAVMKELGIKPPAKSAYKPVIKRAPLPSEIRAKLKHGVVNGLLTQSQADSIWEQLLPSLRQLAREDFDAFAELVCVNDETGEPVVQAPIHKCWTKLRKEHKRLLIWAHCESAKTTQISTLNTVWELGIDPTLRFVILSNTAEQAENIVRNIAGYIERNAEVRAIFPALRPDPNGPWTNKQLRVIRTGTARDPSVRAVGVHGALTGGRVDRLIVDDILDPENTDTDGNRKKVEQWYKAVAAGRLTGRSRVLVVGTAYHSQDLLHTLALQKNFKWFRFPVVRADGTLSWPEQWPKKRVDERRAELGPAEFARQMLCKARDDDEARFKQAWIDQALAVGDGLTMIHHIDVLPEGCMTFTGVDLAAAQNKKSDSCSFFTFIEDKKGFRRILDITHGKFTGPKILETLHDLYRRYHSFLVVESNGVQQFILQFAEEDSNLPTVPFNTGAAKWDPKLGVEGLAIELFNGKWIFPNQANVCTKEMDIFIQQMLYYSPRSHTGDILMSSYFARDWARRVMHSGSGTTGGTAECRILGGGEVPALDRIPPEDTGFSVMD